MTYLREQAGDRRSAHDSTLREDSTTLETPTVVGGFKSVGLRASDQRLYRSGSAPVREESAGLPPRTRSIAVRGPVLGRRHQVGVDAEGEAGIGMAEVLRQGPDRLAGIEQHRGIEVP